MGKITLITGGSRSGKSSFALELAEKSYTKRGFIATAVAFDDEMRDRIARHKDERSDRYVTIEEPYNLTEKLASLDNTLQVYIIDCLTVWLGNCFYKNGDEQAPVEARIDRLFEYLKKPTQSADLIFVTNEVGSGIIPENKLARMFKDCAGICNKKIATIADEVYLCVSGISLKIKG